MVEIIDKYVEKKDGLTCVPIKYQNRFKIEIRNGFPLTFTFIISILHEVVLTFYNVASTRL